MVRQRRSRAASDAAFWQSLIEHVRQQAQVNDLSSQLTDTLPDAHTLPARFGQQKPFPFVRMLRAFAALSEGASLNAVSEQLAVNVVALGTWRARVITLGKRCAYQWPGIERWELNDLGNSSHSTKASEDLGVLIRYCNNEHFSARLVEPLEGLCQRERLAALAAVSVWLKTYRRRTPGLLIQDDDERQKMIWLIESLGGMVKFSGRASRVTDAPNALARHERYPTAWVSTLGRTHTDLLMAQFHGGAAAEPNSRQLGMREFHLLMWLLAIREGVEG